MRSGIEGHGGIHEGCRYSGSKSAEETHGGGRELGRQRAMYRGREGR